jgi:hypothetical protein
VYAARVYVAGVGAAGVVAAHSRPYLLAASDLSAVERWQQHCAVAVAGAAAAAAAGGGAAGGSGAAGSLDCWHASVEGFPV